MSVVAAILDSPPVVWWLLCVFAVIEAPLVWLAFRE
jgi:hypothetical protein